MLDFFRKLFSLLDRRGRVQLLLLPIPMLVSAVLEMASIGMILPVVQISLGNGQTPTGFFARALEYLPAFTMSGDLLIVVSLVFIGFFVVKNLAILATIYAINRYTLRNLVQFSQRLFGSYLHRPYAFHLHRNSADIVRNLTLSAANAFQGLRIALNLILEGVLCLAAFGLLLALEPTITVLVAFTLVAAGLVFYRALGPLFRHWGDRVHTLQADHIRHIGQSLGAIKDVKILNCQDYLIRRYTATTDALAGYQIRTSTAGELPRVFLEIIIVIGFLSVTLLMVSERGSGEEAIAVVGLFGMAALRLVPSTNRILGYATRIKNFSAPLEAVHADITESMNMSETADMAPGNDSISFQGEIRMEDLTFKYDGGDQPALRDVTLRIAKGESVGVVGASGAGKSTLVDVLLCLLTPSSGRLLVDGVDAFQHRRAWQKHFGYVPQHIYLTDDTLRRNIGFAQAERDIDDRRVREALRMASLEDLVTDLPNGLETVIGENGVRLSGGQRQRVGIARALYRDPEILVFDEATSALDNETEHEIKKAIAELSKTKTIIIIAHRLSTIRQCSRLIFMKDGKVTNSGTFEDLKANDEDFHHLIEVGGL